MDSQEDLRVRFTYNSCNFQNTEILRNAYVLHHTGVIQLFHTKYCSGRYLWSYSNGKLICAAAHDG